LRPDPKTKWIPAMARKSASTLEQLNAQIAQLQAEADILRKKEISEVIAKVKDAIKHYGLTAADLGFGSRSRASAAPAGKRRVRKAGAAKKHKSTGVIRYRDADGNAWTGHGRRPGWFIAALKAGQRAEDLAVK
jgi:DNA-binding protein H-NS